ncbi:PDZ domain-containing protein [uncultured Thiohalocapsa sp.]|uniref:PDZ domain-containing protein n=1 Tax=uncultured Thiohalocapsa sp. TaxID=768990 RepID=UPI0025E932D2|nr:PDZ domain-containing protein [uncultured Thiohalocapsa sp.]
MMQPRNRLILTATTTFFVGLLTGAAVFSDVLREQPSTPSPPQQTPEPVPAPPPAPPPDVAAVSIVDAEPEPEPALEPEPAPEPTPPAVSPEVTAALAVRIDELTDGWGRMQAELAELRQRVALMERRKPEAADTDEPAQPRRPASPVEQRDALLRAGVTPDLADDLVWRRSQLSLARLELRDEAARDGWLGSARYQEELRRINEQQVSIEDEIGVDAYDRYLYATGQPNRVAVDSVIPGSAGEDGGLQPGDVIERYGDAQVLDFRDLRAATSAGARGELVPVSVRRGGELLEVWLPRGPIGIGLDTTRVNPGG